MRDVDPVVRLLEADGAFAGASRDAVRALALLMREVVVEPGDALFSEGDAGREAYVVLAGRIALEQRTEDGRRVREVLGPGALFGELALFGDGRRALGARGVETSRLGAIERDDFLAVIRAWPDVALALLRIQTARLLALEGRYRALLAAGGVVASPAEGTGAGGGPAAGTGGR